MKTATVGEVQKNFSSVLKNLETGEEITVTKRGKPIAKITSLDPQNNIQWPDFYSNAIILKGKQVSDIVNENREDRF